MALWKLGALIIVAAGIGLLAARLRPRRRKSAHEPVATKVDAPAPYGAVSVRCGREACEAVRRLAAKRLLPKEAPPLPLPECTAGHCGCHYIHHPDRRSGEERRSGLWSPFARRGSDRRLGRGRRWWDKFPSRVARDEVGDGVAVQGPGGIGISRFSLDGVNVPSRRNRSSVRRHDKRKSRMHLLTRLVRALARRLPPPESDAQTTWTQCVAGGTKAYRQGDYAKAEERFAGAFKRAEVNGSLNHRAAAALNNLGIVCKRQKKFAHAEIALRRALRAYTVMEPDGTRIASVLCNLAELYKAQHRYADAAPLYKQAIAITQKVLGSTHPKLARRLESYARLLEKMNDLIRARHLQARAQAIRAGHENKKR